MFADEEKTMECLHAWKLVGIGKIGRVYECTRCRLVWTPDEVRSLRAVKEEGA